MYYITTSTYNSQDSGKDFDRNIKIVWGRVEEGELLIETLCSGRSGEQKCCVMSNIGEDFAST